MPIWLPLVLLAVLAIGLPVLLFEVSHRRAPHARDSLQVESVFRAGSVHLVWRPVAVAGAAFQRYTILRETLGRSERAAWSILSVSQTELEDHGLVAGLSYRYTVFEVVRALGREEALHGETLVRLPLRTEGVAVDARSS